MLQTNEVGELFATLQAAYSHRWAHGGDVIPVWQKALRRFKRNDVMRAADKAIECFREFPPTLGEFAALCVESVPMLPSADQNIGMADAAYSYARPASKTNPKGNPHRINLPESIAARQVGESAEIYAKRIADAITFARYPKLGQDGRSVGDYT